MAESSSQKTSSPEIIPKEERITLDKPKSPNPFLPASQVDFTFDEITFTTNNKYPSEVWCTAKTLDDSKVWISSPTGGIRGDMGITTFRNVLRAQYLPHSSMYVPPSFITIVRPWFATIRYRGEIEAKGTLKKSCLPPRWRFLMAQIMQCLGGKIGVLDQILNKDATILYCLANGVKVDYAKIIWDDLIHTLNKKTMEKIIPYHRFLSLLLEHMILEYENEELTINPTQVFSVHNLTLKPNQPEEPPFTDHMKAICNLDVHVDSKAPKHFSQTEEVPQVKKPRAKSGLKRKRSSKHTSESSTEASRSQTGQSKKETKFSSAKDKSSSHPSPPTLVVGEMHKETQQAACGLTSLWAISEEGAYSQLSSGYNPSILVDKTKYARDGLKTAHTDSGANEESRADGISLKVKREDLSEILKDIRSAFFTPDSPPDEPNIVSDESEEEEEVAKDKDTEATPHDVPKDTSVLPPPSLKSAQIQELMDQVHLLQSQKEELEKEKEKTEAEFASLKAKPSYPDINQLTELLITSLKPELSKLLSSHDFASCLPTELKELSLKITGLSREITEVKKHVRDMEIELPGDLKEIPTKLDTFTFTISSLLSQLAELKNIKWELPTVFLNFPSQVSSVQEKLKILDSLPRKAIASPAEGEKNTNDAYTNLIDELVNLLAKNVTTHYYTKKLLFDKYCDKMLKRKKISKITKCEVLTKKGPITLKIYREDGSDEVISNLKTRLDQLTQTKQELKIDLNKPLKEQDPFNELNELANEKRKRTSDLKDHSKSTKKYKSSSSA
nr:hypothetical protein [Tanacetum cinerariifolium]